MLYWALWTPSCSGNVRQVHILSESRKVEMRNGGALWIPKGELSICNFERAKQFSQEWELQGSVSSAESVDLGGWTVKAGMNKNKQKETRQEEAWDLHWEFPTFMNEGKHSEMKILPTWNSLSIFEVAEVVRVLKEWEQELVWILSVLLQSRNR